MRIPLHQITLLGGLTAVFFYVPLVDAGTNPTFLRSHRAVYRVDLADADQSTGLRAAHGVMAIEWKEGCRDWSLKQGMQIVFTPRDGQEVSAETRYAGREAKNGNEFRFKFLNIRDGAVVDLRRGYALRDSSDTGVITFYDAQNTRRDLPENALFPVDHFKRLLAAAKNGATETRATLFDGTSGDGLFDSYAMIGRPVAYNVDPTWRLDAAFFPLSSIEDLPLYEVSYDLDSLGVVHGALLDYGAFSLETTLEKIDWLEVPACN